MIDRQNGRIYLSEIFKWYGKDFVKSFGTSDVLSGNEIEKAVLNFASKNLDENDSEFLLNEEFTIEYLKYDWTLNEQKG